MSKLKSTVTAATVVETAEAAIAVVWEAGTAAAVARVAAATAAAATAAEAPRFVVGAMYVACCVVRWLTNCSSPLFWYVPVVPQSIAQLVFLLQEARRCGGSRGKRSGPGEVEGT